MILWLWRIRDNTNGEQDDRRYLDWLDHQMQSLITIFCKKGWCKTSQKTLQIQKEGQKELVKPLIKKLWPTPELIGLKELLSKQP